MPWQALGRGPDLGMVSFENGHVVHRWPNDQMTKGTGWVFPVSNQEGKKGG